MKTVLTCLLLLVATMGGARQNAPAPTLLPVPNGDFERDLAGWTVGVGDNNRTRVSREQAASGKTALKIVDDDETAGSDATSARVAIRGAGVFVLRGKAFPVEGSGLGVYVRVLDRAGMVLGKADDFQRSAPSAPLRQWTPFALEVYTPPNAAFLEVWLHSYGAATVTAFVDDLVFEARGPAALKPPWEPTYKIKPTETARLTAADVVGPDGVVYPDWRHAGVPGGIPKVPVIARIEEFGAKADDDKDDSDALERAAGVVGAKGGGALALGAGTYHLDRPVLITQSNVVLRGAGQNKTNLVFRYAAPPSGVGFHQPRAGQTVTPATWIEAHAAPENLREIRVEIDGQIVAKTTYSQHWGGTFALRTSGASIVSKVANGPHTLRAVATYANGNVRTSVTPVITTTTASTEPARVPSQIGAIMFAGPSSPSGPERKLARDGKRGDTTLALENAAGLAAGDRVRLRAPATPRWNALVKNACPWGEYRRYEFVVEQVDHNTIRLNQPLRILFPVVDGAYVQKIAPLRRCGVEDLSLTQTQKLWTSGIIFSNAWECWARNVSVTKAGRFPLYFLQAKWGEIRDCVLDDAWYKGGGGTAYAGWEYACDGLMENVETRNLRHAPCVQWSASGNVIRNSTFLNSDGQWHSGWTNENLFENCVVGSETGNGGYGYGLWASPPEDEAHGPNGPRNVVYNCDVRSPKAGLWMGGMNENWLIIGNRFVVGSGPAVFAKTASFDHVLKNNVFALGDKTQPAVFLATPDCGGVELTGNTIAGGSGALSGGAGKPLVADKNVFVPLGEAPPPRPTLAVPSIFAWQRKMAPSRPQ